VPDARMTEATIAVAPVAAGSAVPLVIHRSGAPSRPPAQPAARTAPPRPERPVKDRRPWFRRWLPRS
jgi:hypothetical protein